MFKLILEKAEEPEIKLPNPLDHGKSKRVPEKHRLLFIDYAKAFDCVDHNKLRKILKEMGIPDHLACHRGRGSGYTRSGYGVHPLGGGHY